MLYTGKGDKGTSCLYGCCQDQRIGKDEPIFEALGRLDELNSYLGLCAVLAKRSDIKLKEYSVFEVVIWLQDKLFSIQAELGGADKQLSAESVEQMEKWIAEVEAVIPPIKNFIISGGEELAVHFDIARTMARKAERQAVVVLKNTPDRLGDTELAFLNRLSSLLFALGRFTNHKFEKKERSPRYDIK